MGIARKVFQVRGQRLYNSKGKSESESPETAYDVYDIVGVK